MTLRSRIPAVVLAAAYAVAGLLVARPLLATPPPVRAVSEYPAWRPALPPTAGASVRPVPPSREPTSTPEVAASLTPQPTATETPWPTVGATAAAPTFTPLPTVTPPGPPAHVVRTCPIDGDSGLLPPAPVHLVFDQPMDQDPAAVRLSITPELPYRIEWLAPEHLLVRTAPRAEGVEYRLTLHSARSQQGGPLAEPLTLTFGQGGAGAPIPILMYHHVRGLEADAEHEVRRWTVSPQSLAAQLDLLTSLGAHIVSLDDVVDYLTGGEPLPARPVALTFDDGYLSVYANALPILEERGMTATFFVGPAYVDFLAFMDWDELRELAARGHTVGAHGYEHVRTDALGAEQAERQLGASRRRLEEEIGAEVRLFAYPYGYYSERTMAQLAAYGYRGAVTSDPIVRQKAGRALELGRIYMEYDEAVSALADKLPWP